MQLFTRKFSYNKKLFTSLFFIKNLTSYEEYLGLIIFSLRVLSRQYFNEKQIRNNFSKIFFLHSLTATKRRMVIRSGAVFTNPCLLYQDIRTGKKPSKERYTSKVRREKLQDKKKKMKVILFAVFGTTVLGNICSSKCKWSVNRIICGRRFGNFRGKIRETYVGLYLPDMA